MPRVKSTSTQLRDAIKAENVPGIVHDGRSRASVEVVGGKAKGLLGLKAVERELDSYCYRIDLSIPPFFVVSPDVSLTENYAVIKRIAAVMGTDQLAVRSSYVLEDAGQHSFDGVFDTKLNVPLRLLPRAIREVRMTAITDASQRYAAQYGIELDGRMSVIVQVMAPKTEYTGVIYSKFPSPYDIAKMIRRTQEGAEHIDVFRRETFNGNVSIYGSPLVSSEVGDARMVDDIVSAVLRAENAFGYPIISEFAYEPGSTRYVLDHQNPGKVFLLQARRLTNLDDATRFRVPELHNEGLLGQTRAVNGVGDVTGTAHVVFRPRRSGGDFKRITDYALGKAKRFDREHPEGYILVTPYIQFYWDRGLDEVTPNKTAVVAYSELGRHHDFDLAREKGLLYLGFGHEESFSELQIKGMLSEKPIIVTGDRLRVVSDGVQGFVYKVSGEES